MSILTNQTFLLRMYWKRWSRWKYTKRICKSFATEIYRLKNDLGLKIWLNYTKKVYFLFEFLDNARGWYILLNHKTKDYFTEVAGLLGAMIRNYFQVIYILIQKIVIGNTQLAHDVPRTSPGSLQKVLKSETCRGILRGLPRDQYKNWWFYDKNCFSKV